MAARFWVGGTGTWDASDTTHWAATSGGAGGETVPGSGDTVTLDGSSGGGTVTVNTTVNVTSISSGAFTGTLDFSANNNDLTCQIFGSSGTGIRTIKMGNGQWTLTGDNATIWNFLTVTNLTFVRGSNPIICNYNGATGTRTITYSNQGETIQPSFDITAGTDTVNVSNTRTLDLDFTGFKGTLGTGTFVTWGNLTLDPDMTVAASTNAITMAGTGASYTLTTNGVVIDRPLLLGGTGTGSTTYNLADDLTVGSTRTFTMTAGVLNPNNNDITAGFFASSNSNTRIINMGSGTWTLTAASGTVWTTSTTTNGQLNRDTSTISITDTGASDKTWSGGAGNGFDTYYNFSITAGGTGKIIFGSGTRTFNNFTVTGGSKTIQFAATSTNIFEGTVTLLGTAGNLVTIQSSSTTNHTLSKPGGIVSGDYLSISDSTAAPGAWYAGANSTDAGGGNIGWVFTAPPTIKNFAMLGVG